MGVRRVVVGIPFDRVVSEAQNPVAGATRRLQGAERVVPGVWSRPADDPLVPATLARGETMRRQRSPVVVWATALGTMAAFAVVLLGWLALREDSPAFVTSEAGSGRAWTNISLSLPSVPIEPWGTAEPTDNARALAYALAARRSRNPAPVKEPLAISVEPNGALAAEAPAVSLVAGEQAAPKLDPSSLIARGDEFLSQSDVVSARLFYRLAAANGSAAGALAMGSTYDPAFLTRNAVRGVNPEPEKALVWYRRAVELGDPEGKTRTAQLLEVLRLDAARGDPRARAILERATIQ
jgi:hypothetical protein